MNDFRFFVPLDDLQKGKDKQGQEIYKFKGLASTDKEDAEGEFLDYNGFQLDKFKIVNWNHYKDPRFIIGEPTKAEIVKGKGLMVEGNIWANTPVGKEVVDLMEAMQKNSVNGNRLGISVEGKALERDHINKKRVTKARITGIAICPIPINGDTWAELIEKGFTNDSDKVSEYNIQKSANGGETYIIDITNPETGIRYTIDKNFNIKIEKAMSTQVGSGKPVIRESLEGAVKNLTNNERKAVVMLAAAKKQNKLKPEIEKSLINYFKLA